MMDGSKLSFDLRQFTGTEQWFRHSLVRKVLYTEGVRYLAEKAECYWLLDKIATCATMLPELQGEEFQLWKLRVRDRKAALACEDGNGNKLYSEDIEFTDFPMDEIDLYYTDSVILLPSEY